MDEFFIKISTDWRVFLAVVISMGIISVLIQWPFVKYFRRSLMAIDEENKKKEEK
jgi:cellobiose-specific phosphotransferase system component IIC